MPHQCTGIYPGYGHNTVSIKVLLECITGHFSTVVLREILHYQPGYLNRSGFVIIGRGAVVADMGIGVHHNLAEVRWVGENLLVSGHTGVEADFTGGCTRLADAVAVENGAVIEEKYGWNG